MKFIPKSFMIQEMRSKTGNKYLFVFGSISDQYKTHEMCTSVVSQDPSLQHNFLNIKNYHKTKNL